MSSAVEESGGINSSTATLMSDLVDELGEAGTDPCSILLVRPDAGRSCLVWVAVDRESTKRPPFNVVLDASCRRIASGGTVAASDEVLTRRLERDAEFSAPLDRSRQ